MSGDARSLQNCCGADNVPGGFDSHTPPPISVLLKEIPSVSECLESPWGKECSAKYGLGAFKLDLRNFLGKLRKKMQSGEWTALPSLDLIGKALLAEMASSPVSSGRKVINATGILLHTGLGRAPLCKEAAKLLSGMDGYTLTQLDLESGERGRRDRKIEEYLIALTGCEAATVVNNNAFATMLILNTLADKKEVVISRGQLIEIGGSFRMPEVMEKSGSVLKEVGTTNKTHLKDYEGAIGESTGAILHVHTSNYTIRGFAHTPSIAELCALGKKQGLKVIDDIGSGSLVPLSKFGLPDEPLVQDSIKAGSDVVCFSGDKLICGPQSGIICGKKDLVEKIRKNPLSRMFRVDKMTLAALEATLLHFINETYLESLPLYQMLSVSSDKLNSRALKIRDRIQKNEVMTVEIIDDVSFIGSGSLPDEGLKTRCLCLRKRREKDSLNLNGIAEKMRKSDPPLIPRIKDDAILLDMRTLFEGEEVIVEEKLERIMDDYSAH